MRTFLFLLLLNPVLFFATDSQSAEPSPTETRPNILLIVADDLGFSDLGCYGGEIETPNLDRLAAEGMRFTQFYNGAVCVITRAALYTGLYPRHGKGAYATGGLLRPEMTSLGEELLAAGYRTSMTGKWHLGPKPPKRPIDRGFEEFYGLLDGCSSFFNPIKPDPDFYNGGKVRNFAHNEETPTSFPADYYATDDFTDHAIGMIKKFSKTEKPFFLNLNYTAPHFPLHALPEDIAKYRGKYSDGYDPLRERRYRRLIELGLIDEATTKLSKVDPKEGKFRWDYEVVPWDALDPVTRAREEARMEVYAAMVDRLDQGIGRVLQSLEDSGVSDNTVVLFLSDNGGCASWPSGAKEPAFVAFNEGIPVGDPRGYEFVGKAWGWAQNSPFRRHKTWTYEGGICTPLIVRWPKKVEAGTITDAPGNVVDLMPTFLEMAERELSAERNGLDVPEMEGESLLPVFLGGKGKRGPMGWSLYGNHAWRDGDQKIIFNASLKKWELYDLSTDRSETKNLAKVQPEQVKRLVSAWEKWAVKCEVKR